MMRTVQLAISDTVYAAALRDALSHSGPWHVEIVERPNPAVPCVLVLDELNFERVSLPLVQPERVVLISRQDPELLARAWDAGIVSVASLDDTLPTVLLAVMAASLRLRKNLETAGGISPTVASIPARLTPAEPISKPRRCRTP
ncbi:MAG TPA: hypothetical protein VKT49_16155 [Bryobacteraceae bacterium]|nr:hypothetical protein [Bryobacteraceae bacterium]